MSENYVNPNDRGALSSAGVTVAEGAKGAVTGGLMGLIKGPIFGALGGAVATAIPVAIITGIAALVTAIFAPAATALAVVMYPTAAFALIGGVVGLFGGSLLGGPIGAVLGGVNGLGRGREIVNHERGAAQILEAQNAAIQNQMMTAAALQAQAQRPVIIQPASAPVVAPGFTVSNVAYDGQGMGAPVTRTIANDAPSAPAGSHAADVTAGRAQSSVEPVRA
ncbi:MAG: hypothetical protein K2Q12_00195 [Rickettsiales bacterium]|nr:hypothetical protein [Rickettsiales bacterium]